MGKTRDFSYEVDPLRLDEQWYEQPAIVAEAGAELAEARKRLGYAEADFKLLQAELKRAIRNTPERYGCSAKCTVDEVECTMIVQAEYQRANRKVIDLEHAVDVLKHQMDGLRDRKAALENAVILYCRDYGSEPRLRGDNARLAQDRMHGDRWKGVPGVADDEAAPPARGRGKGK